MSLNSCQRLIQVNIPTSSIIKSYKLLSFRVLCVMLHVTVNSPYECYLRKYLLNSYGFVGFTPYVLLCDLNVFQKICPQCCTMGQVITFVLEEQHGSSDHFILYLFKDGRKVISTSTRTRITIKCNIRERLSKRQVILSCV